MSTLKERITSLASLSIPMIGNAILSQMINLITMLYVGRLDGAIFMGAATLGNMLLGPPPISLLLISCLVQMQHLWLLSGFWNVLCT
jgi:Na+-driven multidrug efflux pump